MISHGDIIARHEHAAERFKRRLTEIAGEHAIGLSELFIASEKELLIEAMMPKTERLDAGPMK